MGLLNKFDNVVIENNKRLCPEDIEFCKLEEARYINAFQAYEKTNKIIKAAYEIEQSNKKDKYDYGYIEMYGDMGVRKFQDNLVGVTSRFISKIIYYFNHKYNLELPEETDYENGFNERYDDISKLNIVCLDFVLDKYIFNNLKGITFEEKGIETMLKKNNSYKNQEWNKFRECWNYEIKGKYIRFRWNIKDVIPILKYYDNGEQKLSDDFSNNKVLTITSYQNGTNKVKFLSVEDALDFAKKYLGYIEFTDEEIERIKADN